MKNFNYKMVAWSALGFLLLLTLLNGFDYNTGNVVAGKSQTVSRFAFPSPFTSPYITLEYPRNRQHMSTDVLVAYGISKNAEVIYSRLDTQIEGDKWEIGDWEKIEADEKWKIEIPLKRFTVNKITVTACKSDDVCSPRKIANFINS
mgnify:CR=1 FL=1